MAFVILNTTPTSAVANGGTIAFVFGTNSTLGQVRNEGGHSMFSEGLQANFNFPQDFTISWSAATATVTYNGTTPIPAGTLVRLQVSYAGELNYLTTAFPSADALKDYLGNARVALGREYRILFGAVATASATSVLNAVAVADANLHTLASAVVMDVPRNTQLVSSNVGDTTQVITMRGLDETGAAMTESVTLNGTTIVAGKKAFKQINSYQSSALLAGNLSIGSNTSLGLPFFVPGGTGAGLGYILSEIQDGTRATAGTAKGGDLTKATATTGDVRGTWIPNAAPNGTIVYEVIMCGSDLTFRGVPQFAG